MMTKEGNTLYGDIDKHFCDWCYQNMVAVDMATNDDTNRMLQDTPSKYRHYMDVVRK